MGVLTCLAAYGMPDIGTPDLMNYNSVILVGCFVIALVWWLAHARTHYHGPKLAGLYLLNGVDTEHKQ